MKQICILLALALVLCCAPAMAAEGDAILGRADENSVYFNYCFEIDDTLYLSGYGSLCTYRVGDADLEEYTYVYPEDEEGSYDINTMPFADGGKLYGLNLATQYGENTEFIGASLASLTLKDDGTVAMEELCEVDWSDLVEYYDNNSYPTRPEAILGAAGKAYIRYYDAKGEYRLSSIDLTDGAMESVDELRNIFAMTPYRDDTLLLEEYSYEAGEKARLLVFDPADESTRLLGEINVEEYSPLQGLAYDADADTVYCVKGGEICALDLQSGEIGPGVTDMPLEVYGGTGCMLAGGYYALGAEGAVIRNLDPSQRAQSRLKICDTSWSDSVSNAYYRFANAHGDVSVVMSHEYSETANLIENMMNRDDSVDIYVLSTSTPVYNALYNRGYLMELDGSEKVAALAERLYPTLRENLSHDGRLVAIPVSTYSWAMGINEKALEALGLTMADVPDDWPGFLDFLSGLSDALNGANGVRLFYSEYSIDDARYELFYNIFESYQNYVNLNDPAMGYDTDLLRGLIEKLEQMDFAALGCAEANEGERDDNVVSYVGYSEDAVLIQSGIGCTIGNFYSDYTPLLLRISPDVSPQLVLETTVAIVNPYTRNREAALAFMDELVDDLSSATLYNIDPTQSEPIRGAWNEENLAEARKNLEELRAELEQADAADRQMYEESVREAEENLAYVEKFGWDVSPTELEWYRGHDDNIAIATVNWLYADENGEAWELMSQYRDGQISAQDMLTSIDKKVQMMMLEGN